MSALFFRLAAVCTWIEQKIALIRVRIIEAELDGQIQALEYVNDMDTRMRIMLAKARTQESLAKARSQMIAKFPPGTRFTWSNG